MLSWKKSHINADDFWKYVVAFGWFDNLVFPPLSLRHVTSFDSLSGQILREYVVLCHGFLPHSRRNYD